MDFYWIVLYLQGERSPAKASDRTSLAGDIYRRARGIPYVLPNFWWVYLNASQLTRSIL